MDYRRDVARMVLAQVKASEGEVQSGRQDSSTKTWGVPLARPRPRTLRLLPGLLLPSSSLLPPPSSLLLALSTLFVVYFLPDQYRLILYTLAHAFVSRGQLVHQYRTRLTIIFGKAFGRSVSTFPSRAHNRICRVPIQLGYNEWCTACSIAHVGFAASCSSESSLPTAKVPPYAM